MRESKYTAIIKKENDWWIGWIEEVPGVNCQGHTHDELMENLAITLKEALEFNRQDAIATAKQNYKEELVFV